MSKQLTICANCGWKIERFEGVYMDEYGNEECADKKLHIPASKVMK
jgi:hypothetical protein